MEDPYPAAGAAGMPLAHGYTAAAAARLAGRAARGHPSRMLAPDEQYAIALSAVAEAVLAAPGRPAEDSLLHAARDAISRAVEREYSARGMSWRDPGTEMPRHARYWRGPAPAPFDEQLTDEIAVRQVLGAVGESHRRVLAALAEAGTHQGAAALLGCQPDTFRSRLSKARHAAWQAWFDDQAPPSRAWGSDRRGGAGRPRPATQVIRSRSRDRAAAARRRQAGPARPARRAL